MPSLSTTSSKLSSNELKNTFMPSFNYGAENHSYMSKLRNFDVQFCLSFINEVNYCAITFKKESSENEMKERQKEKVLSPPSAELHTPFCQDLLSSYCSRGMPCSVCQRWACLTVKVTLRGLRGTWAFERGRLLHGRFKCFLLCSKTWLAL